MRADSPKDKGDAYLSEPRQEHYLASERIEAFRRGRKTIATTLGIEATGGFKFTQGIVEWVLLGSFEWHKAPRQLHVELGA